MPYKSYSRGPSNVKGSGPETYAGRKKAVDLVKPAIQCTSRQSRFHLETLESQTGIDLKTVNISVGDKELLVDADLKLKAGVRYALIGRNGTGKSTLLQAISQKLIPGIGSIIRVLLLAQIEGASEGLDAPPGLFDSNVAGLNVLEAEADAVQDGGSSEETANEIRAMLEEERKKAKEKKEWSALEHVIRGDAERTRQMREVEALSKAIETGSLKLIQRVIFKRQFDDAARKYKIANDLAKLRSGALGWDARTEEVKAEEALRIAHENLLNVENIPPDASLMDEALAALTEGQLALDLMDATKTPVEAARLLHGLGFSEEMMNAPYSRFLIISQDLEALLWLESHLCAQERTLVITSHDQEFLENVAQETILIRNKELKYFEGSPRQYEVAERRKRKNMIKQSEALDKKKSHIENSIKQGKAAAKKSGDDNKLRMAKSRQKKLDERFGLEQSAKGGRFKLNRDLEGYHLTSRAEIVIEDLEPPIKIKIPDPPELKTVGNLVHFDNVSFRYPKAKKNQLEGITFTLGQGGRCSFIGQNGQGKSTLAKLIMGEIQPTSGTISRHPTIRIGYFSQHSVEQLTRAGVTAEKTTGFALGYFMTEVEKAGSPASEQEARACLGSFGLPGKLASDTPIAVLSGGQKVRLALAVVVWQQPHLLLLDEVTTHVDAATIQGLGRSLRRYRGGIILVTHDRWFNKVVVEGASVRSQAVVGNEELSDISDSSDEDVDGSGRESSRPTGKTYRVGGGKIRVMDGGIDQYVAAVWRKVAKRTMEADLKFT